MCVVLFAALHLAIAVVSVVCLQLHLAVAVVSVVLFTVACSYCCCVCCFVYSYI